MNVAKVIMIGRDGVELDRRGWPYGPFGDVQNGDTLSIQYTTLWLFDLIAEALREVRFLDKDGAVLWSTPNVKRAREALELRIVFELPSGGT